MWTPGILLAVADNQWGPAAFMFALAAVCGVAFAWLVRPYYALRFRGRDGRARVLRFWVKRRLRREFAATLAAHRAAAAHFAVPAVQRVDRG